MYYKITSRWQKHGGHLLNQTKTSTDWFVLKVSTVGRFQNRICIDCFFHHFSSRPGEGEKKLIAMKKPEQLQLTLDKVRWNFELSIINLNRLFSEGACERVWLLECLQQWSVWSSIFWVIKKQLRLWICKIFA